MPPIDIVLLTSDSDREAFRDLAAIGGGDLTGHSVNAQGEGDTASERNRISSFIAARDGLPTQVGARHCGPGYSGTGLTFISTPAEHSGHG